MSPLGRPNPPLELLALLLVLGCSSETPAEPLVADTVRKGDLEITATVSRNADQVAVVASLNNLGDGVLDLELEGGDCRLLLRFWRSDLAKQPILDEAPPGTICAGIGWDVSIPPGGSQEITTVRSLLDLRAQGLPQGLVFVTAYVPSLNNGGVEVAAGWFDSG